MHIHTGVENSALGIAASSLVINHLFPLVAAAIFGLFKRYAACPKPLLFRRQQGKIVRQKLGLRRKSKNRKSIKSIKIRGRSRVRCLPLLRGGSSSRGFIRCGPSGSSVRSRRVVSGLSAGALPLGRARNLDGGSPLRARLPGGMCGAAFFLPGPRSRSTRRGAARRARHRTGAVRHCAAPRHGPGPFKRKLKCRTTEST